MTTNLVVADPERSEKTICLAVSPSMKKLGVRNRCRVFEIPRNIKYIMAVPRMQKYIDYAAEIYGIYLRYFAPEDIYVYSIDEAFMDVTQYLGKYHKTAKEMAVFLMDTIAKEIGVRATAGIGTNLYLCKIALDVTAKHSPDFIGILDEKTFIDTLWEHRPLTDFWRIGQGTATRLERFGIYTMRQIAHAPEDLLYREFGVDAELMIDHAWGREPVTMKDIQEYRPKNNSFTSGQVLSRDYSHQEGVIIVKEMADDISLQLIRKHSLATTFTLIAGYAKVSGQGKVSGSLTFPKATNNDSTIRDALVKVYERVADKNCLVRRFWVVASGITGEDEGLQLDLFDEHTEEDERKNKVQKAVLSIKEAFGKNAILKGMDYEEGATQRERNMQIGGHKSGEQ